MSPAHAVELEDLRRAVQAGAFTTALAIPLGETLPDPDAEVVRVTYRAVSLDALGDRAQALAECDGALARLRDPAAIGRVQVCAAAIAERSGDADAAQTRLGLAITAFGRAARVTSESGWLVQSRAWAMIERSRLLRRLGRPAEAERLEKRGRQDLAAQGIDSTSSVPVSIAS